MTILTYGFVRPQLCHPPSDKKSKRALNKIYSIWKAFLEHAVVEVASYLGPFMHTVRASTQKKGPGIQRLCTCRIIPLFWNFVRILPYFLYISGVYYIDHKYRVESIYGLYSCCVTLASFSLSRLRLSGVSLKEEQLSAIWAVYEGQDVFVCLPTG